MRDLYSYDDEVLNLELRTLGVDVPAWISQDITVYDIASITQGGCESGAYMPAVTYHEALGTMSKHGDDVLQYIEDSLGELPQPKKGVSWAGMAVHFLSYAVDLWASTVECELLEDILPNFDFEDLEMERRFA